MDAFSKIFCILEDLKHRSGTVFVGGGVKPKYTNVSRFCVRVNQGNSSPFQFLSMPSHRFMHHAAVFFCPVFSLEINPILYFSKPFF
jgi:hypothetical protein